MSKGEREKEKKLDDRGSMMRGGERVLPSVEGLFRLSHVIICIK
jgi:hypothetical protein